MHACMHVHAYKHTYWTIYACIRTNIHACMHTHILDYTSISCIHACMHACTRARAHTRTHTLENSPPRPLTARTHARACTHTHLPKRTHARMCVCAHPHAHTHAHTRTHAQPGNVRHHGRPQHVRHRQRRRLPRRLTVTLTRKLPTRTIADSDGPPAVASTSSSDPEASAIR